MREVRKFEFVCDGYRPDGRICTVNLKTEQYGVREAEIIARDHGWTHDHRGWICNAIGHRGDRTTGG